MTRYVGRTRPIFHRVPDFVLLVFFPLWVAVEQVFVRTFPCAALPCQYFRNVIPEVPVVMCHACCRFFHEADFEFAVLQKKACPFCRVPVGAAPKFQS